MIRVAVITPAVAVETFGVTEIETLLPDATVPLFGEIDSEVVAYLSPVIAQSSGAVPGLERVNTCCVGLLPWIALNVSVFAEIAIAGRGEGPTVGIGGRT